MSTTITTKDGKKRDAKQSIELFFFKKFGYKWKQQLKRGEIPKDKLDAAKEEFDAMMEGLKNGRS